MSKRHASVAAAALTMFAATGCGKSDASPRSVAPAAPAQKVDQSPAPTPSKAASAKRPGRATSPPKMQPGAPSGPVASFVQRVAKRAATSNEKVIVYVGAKWCEPCQRFKKALYAGELNDRGLSGVRFVEYDYDRDAERLAPAGYKTRYLPLFAVPKADGSTSEHRFMGARKGPGAVDFIVPRLTAIMNAADST